MRLALALVVLLLVGCGGSPPIPGSPASASDSRTERSLTAAAGITLPLRSGWNAVGLQGARITAVAPGEPVAGLAFFDGRGYLTRAVSADSLNEGAGTRRGLWFFATQATSLTYQSEGSAEALDLEPGWNLVAFPSPVIGLVVPDSVLGIFTEIQADNTYRSVDVRAGAPVHPGEPTGSTPR